jgi:hypothetical protein
MPHYEVLLIKTAPDRVQGVSQDYSAFGWKRINRETYKKLLANPDQPDEVKPQESAETVKTNQTIYPDSPTFSDFGDSVSLVHPSPNDSSTYDGLQSLYFKRDSALPHQKELAELKTRLDEITEQINTKENELEKRRAIGHLLFGIGSFPLFVGFFVLMGGLPCAVLAYTRPDRYSNLQNPGTIMLICGGVFFLIGWILVIWGLVKGVNRQQEKKNRADWAPLQKEKMEILAKAVAYQATPENSPLPPIQIKITTSDH